MKQKIIKKLMFTFLFSLPFVCSSSELLDKLDHNLNRQVELSKEYVELLSSGNSKGEVLKTDGYGRPHSLYFRVRNGMFHSSESEIDWSTRKLGAFDLREIRDLGGNEIRVSFAPPSRIIYRVLDKQLGTNTKYGITPHGDSKIVDQFSILFLEQGLMKKHLNEALTEVFDRINRDIIPRQQLMVSSVSNIPHDANAKYYKIKKGYLSSIGCEIGKEMVYSSSINSLESYQEVMNKVPECMTKSIRKEDSFYNKSSFKHATFTPKKDNDFLLKEITNHTIFDNFFRYQRGMIHDSKADNRNYLKLVKYLDSKVDNGSLQKVEKTGENKSLQYIDPVAGHKITLVIPKSRSRKGFMIYFENAILGKQKQLKALASKQQKNVNEMFGLMREYVQQHVVEIASKYDEQISGDFF